ncbi:hypothetical protein [Mycolicibacterium sphagni]|uniref:MuF-like minor capsid protein n=1 Tax=Mycolicibacterium sphagni TaxID=1786 RepID=A0A255DRQ7_9MYCO|nr:hypothetical protein [Mycolicibacterium sphagni]OYN81770.1 hypothetical protein CG716_05355 [Mycolicibacterium sphagni]
MADDAEDKKRKAAALPELTPIPALAAWYATQHVQAQEGIAASVSSGLALLWPIINLGDLDKSTPSWLHATTLQIEKGWNESAERAYEYVQQALLSVEPDATPPARVETKFPVQEIQTAMRVRGPVEVKRQIARAVPEQDAMEAGKKASDGVGATKATDGGRTQVLELVRREAPKRLSRGKPIGYARKTDGNPCYFCAILASQGAVYFSESSFDRSNSMIREVKWTSNKDKGTRRAFIGDGPAKVHDHCQCTMRPVFSKSDSLDDRAKYFRDQWMKHGRGGKGSDGKYRSAENNFRRNYVPPPPYSADVLDLSERRQIISDVQNNRELLLARGFKADSPNVKFLDDSIRKLSASA